MVSRSLLSFPLGDQEYRQLLTVGGALITIFIYYFCNLLAKHVILNCVNNLLRLRESVCHRILIVATSEGPHGYHRYRYHEQPSCTHICFPPYQIVYLPILPLLLQRLYPQLGSHLASLLSLVTSTFPLLVCVSLSPNQYIQNQLERQREPANDQTLWMD